MNRWVKLIMKWTNVEKIILKHFLYYAMVELIYSFHDVYQSLMIPPIWLEILENETTNSLRLSDAYIYIYQ